MRKKIVAGNWKMNTTPEEGVILAKEIESLLKQESKGTGVILCPPFTHIKDVVAAVSGSSIEVGAQNCADQLSGAYTGEISVNMIKAIGAGYVIIGHSERRAYYHETNEILFNKVKLALANGLKVIYCCGETLEERNDNRLFDVIREQLFDGLFGLSADSFADVIVAYEPVWAIGTGVTATKEQAQEMHQFIRSLISEKYGAMAETTTILYGGSCKPSNAVELFAQKDVDGGLIGGAALNAKDFVDIIKSF